MQEAVPSADGKIRLVLAHSDPGVPNWLDVGSHRDGLLTYRWFWPKSDPTLSARVVPQATLAGALPEDTPAVSADDRRAELRARKQHLAWRFRT